MVVNSLSFLQWWFVSTAVVAPFILALYTFALTENPELLGIMLLVYLPVHTTKSQAAKEFVKPNPLPYTKAIIGFFFCSLFPFISFWLILFVSRNLETSGIGSWNKRGVSNSGKRYHILWMNNLDIKEVLYLSGLTSKSAWISPFLVWGMITDYQFTKIMIVFKMCSYSSLVICLICLWVLLWLSRLR